MRKILAKMAIFLTIALLLGNVPGMAAVTEEPAVMEALGPNDVLDVEIESCGCSNGGDGVFYWFYNPEALWINKFKATNTGNVPIYDIWIKETRDNDEPKGKGFMQMMGSASLQEPSYPFVRI
ncbi:MAG: hypothetical protein U0L09_03425 [Christensenellales bacterium]|nr:hypothetical protein [Christensenellales bacterium]